ncbi:hypothetical protein BH11PSE11_BH11PSE11_19780 [soil metagenome]
MAGKHHQANSDVDSMFAEAPSMLDPAATAGVTLTSHFAGWVTP